MNELFMATGTCFIMGLITTLHPCPFTTNLAAISLLTSWSGQTRRSVIFAILFITGYLTAFFVLSVLIGSGVYAVPDAGLALQRHIPVFLGPVFILAGMFHADLIHIDRNFIDHILKRISGQKQTGFHALPLGILMALSFCPATAAIYFGALIPLALGHGQVVLFPLVYATGAAIPLIAISIFVVRGIQLTGNRQWLNRLPVIAGWILIIIGVYLSIQNIYLPLIK